MAIISVEFNKVIDDNKYKSADEEKSNHLEWLVKNHDKDIKQIL